MPQQTHPRLDVSGRTLMKTVELFAGTGSFTKVMRDAGLEVCQIELHPQPENPVEFAIDIRHICEEKVLRSRGWDLLWASPPCQSFSIASVSHHWDAGPPLRPKSEAAKLGLELLRSTLRYIAQEKPRYWWIENPRGMMRRHFELAAFREGVLDYDRKTLSYCGYGDSRMKPTDLWTNAHWWKPKPICKNGEPCHVPAPRGSKTPGSTQGIKGAKDRGVVPPALFVEILDQYAKTHEKNPTNLPRP